MKRKQRKGLQDARGEFAFGVSFQEGILVNPIHGSRDREEIPLVDAGKVGWMYE